MYKIIGADGSQYGPVSLSQIQQWIAEGRVNAETSLQAEGSLDWKPAREFSEIGALFSTPPPIGTNANMGRPAEPPIAQRGPGAAGTGPVPRMGLAITSFVLGILGLLCLGLLAGLPAIVTGHIAHRRAHRSPVQYGGVGFAIAGFALGYASVVMTLILAALLIPALASGKAKARSATCSSNMRQISVAFHIWAAEHNNEFPFNVSTNAGGSMELAAPDSQGFDANPEAHLSLLGDSLRSPNIMVCPSDRGRRAAENMESLSGENITYRLNVSPEVAPDHPEEVLLYCPIHHQYLRCDGGVEQRKKGFKKVELPPN